MDSNRDTGADNRRQVNNASISLLFIRVRCWPDLVMHMRVVSELECKQHNFSDKILGWSILIQ